MSWIDWLGITASVIGIAAAAVAIVNYLRLKIRQYRIKRLTTYICENAENPTADLKEKMRLLDQLQRSN